MLYVSFIFFSFHHDSNTDDRKAFHPQGFMSVEFPGATSHLNRYPQLQLEDFFPLWDRQYRLLNGEKNSFLRNLP